MNGEKLIQITKKDGSKHLVPAGQRTIYENFNARAKKLRRDKDLVTIEDYEAPAETSTAATVTTEVPGTPVVLPPANGSDKKTAAELIELISKAPTPDDVTALIEGEARVSVLKAAETRIAELTK